MEPEITYDWLERLTNIYRAWRGRSRPLLRPFEQAIVSAVERHLAQPLAQILREQLAQFNFVQRGPVDLDSDNRETCLYCFKRGVPFRDFPVKFPVLKEEFKLAELRVQHNRGTITASLCWSMESSSPLTFAHRNRSSSPEESTPSSQYRFSFRRPRYDQGHDHEATSYRS